ncbi:hypothetical protein BLNAU_18386 [Blattamonas nauphoetae]|uniref:Uncharacterized protein n=1 Tax=Blattamonas nauphoetae TaxID=2049346 RepID=A0ABQ9X4M0_9EUKA|nr:hypothetical protein BLNAU_18386 [Blattamonas nauphoetae]
MIERNTTILTMTDMILFPPQRLHQRRPEQCLGDVRRVILHISEQIKQREEVLVHPTNAPLIDNHHHTRESEPAATIVKKTINHSLSIFNQSAQENRSPTTPHEVGSKADKADTLSEMIMVQSGVEVRIYPHSKGSSPPPLGYVVTGQAGKFSTMLASCGVLAHSSDFLKQLLHLSETIFTVSELLIVFSQSSHTTNASPSTILFLPTTTHPPRKRQPHNDRSEEGNRHKCDVCGSHDVSPPLIHLKTKHFFREDSARPAFGEEADYGKDGRCDERPLPLQSQRLHRFLSRAALFVAEGSRQFRKCKLEWRHVSVGKELQLQWTAGSDPHHEAPSERGGQTRFPRLQRTPRAGESSVLEDSLREPRVRVPLIFDRLSVFTGFQHTPSRDMPNLHPSAANAVFSEEHDRDAKDAAKTRFESAAVNEVLPPNLIYSVLLFLHLERLQPPDGRYYPTASDEADGIGPL